MLTCNNCLKQYTKTNKARHIANCKPIRTKNVEAHDASGEDETLVEDTVDYDIGLMDFVVEPLHKLVAC